MLGHVVAAYLRELGAEVVTSEARYGGEPCDALLQAVAASGCLWVINALGRVKQKSSDPAELYLANAIFPLHLLQVLGPQQRVIHASTDCVFSGRRGWYAADAPKDAGDVYGLSKVLGEMIATDSRVVVMRVSIIGPERSDGTGLFGWFMKQTGPVCGFTHHRWNGITTLEWATAAAEVIQGRAPVQRGVVQIGVAQPVSKYELLCLLRDTWGRTVEVRPVSGEDPVDRTLQPDWARPPLAEQLQRLRAWMTRG
jgi:dTDP-4-dehydrorhamnose reductase